MGFVKEFKEFAVKGNVMDLAVGVIIGAAFGKIIDSIVNDLVMPVVAAIIGKPDFSNMYVVLRGTVADGTALVEARKVEGAAIIAYGNFITIAINFIILAFIIFLMVKQVNKLKKAAPPPPPAAPPAPSEDVVLLTQIRDLLKSRG